MKSLSHRLVVSLRCSAVIVLLLAMLLASTAKVYGQGWVPGGERRVGFDAEIVNILLNPDNTISTVLSDGSSLSIDSTINRVSRNPLVQHGLKLTDGTYLVVGPGNGGRRTESGVWIWSSPSNVKVVENNFAAYLSNGNISRVSYIDGNVIDSTATGDYSYIDTDYSGRLYGVTNQNQVFQINADGSRNMLDALDVQILDFSVLSDGRIAYIVRDVVQGSKVVIRKNGTNIYQKPGAFRRLESNSEYLIVCEPFGLELRRHNGTIVWKQGHFGKLSLGAVSYGVSPNSVQHVTPSSFTASTFVGSTIYLVNASNNSNIVAATPAYSFGRYLTLSPNGNVLKQNLNSGTYILQIYQIDNGVGLSWPWIPCNVDTSFVDFVKHSRGYILTEDQGHRAILFDKYGHILRQIGGVRGFGMDNFSEPHAVCVAPTGDFYIADSGNNRIKYYDEQGKLRKIWGTYGDGPGQFDYPQGVAVGPDGLVYVADTYNHRIQVFTKDGNYITQFGSFGTGPNNFNTPVYIAVDEESTLYVADRLNDRVAIFVRAGALPPSTSKSVNPVANAAGWNASNVALTFTATANGSTVKDIRTSVDNAAEVIHNGSTATVNLTTDGTHSVGYYATDTDGHNEVTQYTTVRIDTVKPVTTHSFGAGKLTLTASDDRSGIAKTYYKLDGAAEVEYTAAIDIAAGNHTVEYRSVDIAGNSETAKLFSSAVGVASVSIAPASVTGGTPAAGTITLDAPAPAGGVQVSVTSASGAIGLPSTVTVAAGQTSATLTITTNAVAADTDTTITASVNGVSATGSLQVRKPVLGAATINPASVAGGDTAQLTVTMNGPAPAGGVLVALTSGNAKVTVPASVTVAAGQSSAVANVVTQVVTTDTDVVITAASGGVSKASTIRVLSPRAVPAQVTFTPATVLGGTASSGKVKLASGAPTGGVVVTLQVGGAGATVPATVTVTAGATEATFNVTTQAVTAQKDVTITASASGVSATGMLTIRPIVPSTLDATPSSGTGGFTSTAKLTITDPAPTGGLVIPITSNNTAVKVPTAVSVAAGKTTVSFSITTTAVTSDQTATVTATLNGASVTTSVTAKLAAPADITFAPSSVGGGATATGTLLLTSPAPAGGLVVSLTSGNAAVKVPASVTVAAGANSATFVATTSPVGQETSVAIMATAAGVSEFGVLLVTPAKPSSIAFLPASILGGKPSTATLSLSGVAPVGGLTVQLRSLTPSVVSVPASVVVPAGKNVVTFVAGTTSVLQSAVVTVEATANGYTASGNLTVRPVIVSKVVLTPATVVGGTASKGAVTLSDPAPTGGVTVTVASSDPSVTVSPASQVVALGKTAAAFTASTTAVGAAKSVTITVTANGVPVTTTLIVTPIAVASVTIAPATVISGSSATGTVKLAKAAVVDTTVALSVDAPAVASIPATVIVPKGALTATFAIGTTKQTVQKIVTVSATTGGKPVVGKLTVKP
jgi:hypothetical protein